MVKTGTGYGYDILDYSSLRVAVFTSLYSPYLSFPSLAEGLKDLEAGNGTRMLSIARGEVTKIECDVPASNPVLADLSTAIYCSDAQELKYSPGQLQAKFLNMTQEFGTFADVWIEGSARCMCVRSYPL